METFATGLHEPLGLKIVDEKIYTVGDNQITRFHDLNNDGRPIFWRILTMTGMPPRAFMPSVSICRPIPRGISTSVWAARSGGWSRV